MSAGRLCHACARLTEPPAAAGAAAMKLGASLIIGGALFALAIFVGLFAPWLAHTDPVMDANLPTRKSHRAGSGGSAPTRRAATSTPRRARRAHLADGRHRLAARQQRHRRDTGRDRGLLGGWWDDVVNGLTNLMLAIPSLIFALAIMAVLGPGLTSLLIALGLTNWSFTCRIARASTLSLKSQGYVQAGKSARLRRFAYHDYGSRCRTCWDRSLSSARWAWAARYWPKPHFRSSASELPALSKLGQHAVRGPRPDHNGAVALDFPRPRHIPDGARPESARRWLA